MEQTQQRPSSSAILDAAEATFARVGFPAATVKDIAGAARVNVALIYYYFTDKEGLYHAVLARAVEGFIAQVSPALAGHTAPPDAVAALIQRQGRALAAKPNLARLIARELVDHDASHAKPQLSSLAANLFRHLCETIERGQREGTFRRDFDPRFAAISCISQMIHFVMARPAIQILLGDTPIDARVESAFAVHAAQFALAALAPSDANTHAQADGA